VNSGEHQLRVDSTGSSPSTGDVATQVPKLLQRLKSEYGVDILRKRWNQRLELVAVTALAATFLVWFAWPLLWSASANARLVAAFNTDEQAQLMLLKEAIEHRTPRLGYYQYGYTYLNLGLFPLLLLSAFRDITEQQIIVWLRMIPALFALATVVVTFLIARRYFGRLAAWLSALLLSVTVLHFLRMSVMSHPDTAQLFFLTLGMYFCGRLAEDGRSQWLMAASAAAGLAFGSKYSGLFLLPVVGLCGLLRTMQLDATQIQVNSVQVARVSRLLTSFASVGLSALALVVIPSAAAPYVGTEYYGVSMPQFFGNLRVISLVAGVGLALVAVEPPLWAYVRQRPKLAHLLQLGILSAITFALAFFMTSPFHVFSVRSGFWRGFLYESLHTSFGHVFAAQNDKMQWLSLLSSPQLLDPFVLALAGVGLALTVYRVARRGWQALLDPESVLWVWTLFYFGFLAWRVNVRTHRALLPIVPFLLVLAAHSVAQVIGYAGSGRSRRLALALAIVSLLIVLGLVLPESLQRVLEFRQATSSREQTSEAVVAGHWLLAHYPPSTRILYDPTSYVPPAFADAHETPWGGTPQLLETLEPDVVIVNRENADQFSDVRQAPTYARDEALFLAKHEYYETLADGKAGYVLVSDFGSVELYERQGE
jgi:4-amino-4-deoxy-L-arabinose transferase-like glycosyltransferase